jgi:N-acetylneuraminate lyase
MTKQKRETEKGREEGSGRGFRLIAATFTPMNEDGSLALERIEPYAAYLLRRGVSAVFVGGTTGESLSLTTQERMQVAARWRA